MFSHIWPPLPLTQCEVGRPLSPISYTGWRCGVQTAFQVLFPVARDGLKVSWQGVGLTLLVQVWATGNGQLGARGQDHGLEMTRHLKCGSQSLWRKSLVSVSWDSQGSSPLSSACRSYLVVLVELGKCNCKEARLLTLPSSTDLTCEAPVKVSCCKTKQKLSLRRGLRDVCRSELKVGEERSYGC